MREDPIGSRLEEFRLDVAALDLRPARVAAAAGYPGGHAPEPFAHMIRETLEAVAAHADVRAGFRLFPPGALTLEDRAFRLAGVGFEAGAIIGRSLRGSTAAAVFAATVGRAYDDWIRAHFDRNDLVRGFLIDAIGSEIAEAAAEWLDAQIVAGAAARGLAATNRLSPGYCGWCVAEQHKLFGFLPERFLGITLTATSMMIPLKSVSGVVGLGSAVERGDYPCRMCDLGHCYRRRAEFEE
ncbi:MAG: methionine synthase [Planctomycetes bacterium]|nr:methionine synthase [Planctomycetota bacterium]